MGPVNAAQTFYQTGPETSIVAGRAFHPVHEAGGQRRHQQIDRADIDERQRCRIDIDGGAAGLQQLGLAEHGDQGRILDQIQDLIGDGGQAAAQRLRQHDVDEHVQIADAERLAGFKLAAVHGLDAAAEDFNIVGGVVEDEGGHDGAAAVHRQADKRQAEVDEHQLQHQRRSSLDIDIDT